MLRSIIGFFVVALLSVGCYADQNAAPLHIAESGRPLYTIVVAPDSSAVEINAAKSLQLMLWKITGSRFELKTVDHPDLSHPLIAVGPTMARQIDPNLDLSLKSLGQEGIILRTSGDHLILSGAAGASRGTIYAVYTLLQQIGCRWWSPTESRIPRITDLSIDRMDVRYIPPLEYREVYEFSAFDPNWSVQNRINGNNSKIPPDFGGHITYAGESFVHTFEHLVPPEKYFPEHPEWFSEVNGKRIGPPSPSQLCLTNPQLLEFVKQRVREIAAKVPPDTDAIISVSQNDNSNPCQCANCLKLEQYEGSHSGPLIHFVNAIADDIRTDYPRIVIDTLAYHYTQKPPAHVRPRDNVIIRLCDIECSFAQPLTDPINSSFATDAHNWSLICNRLYVWDYIVNFAHYVQPFPNLYVLGPNVQFFVNNGVKGIFEQGNYHSYGGDFAILRQWVLAQLLWDPSLDGRQLISQFLDEYYGNASHPIAQYIDLRHAAAKTIFVGISDPSDSPWLTPQLLNQSFNLLEKAKSLVADNPTVARRVELLEAPVLYAIVQSWRHKQVAMMLNRPWPYEHDKDYYLDQLSRIIADGHITALSEGRSEGDLQTWITSQRHDPADISPPPQVANLPRADWYDLQDRDFNIIGKGNGWVSDESDPKASDGRAAIMPGNHPQWAIQAKMSGQLASQQPNRPWNIYASVRVKADADPSVTAFLAGVYDNAKSAAATPQTTVKISQIPDGEYHWYKLASIPMSHTMLIWFAPPNDDKIQQIAVDRILFIRADVDPGTLISP